MLRPSIAPKYELTTLSKTVQYQSFVESAVCRHTLISNMWLLAPYLTIIALCIANLDASYSISLWNTSIVNVNDPNSRTIKYYAWYPKTTERKKFPLFVFGHCLFGELVYYDYIWQSTVPNGYIVIMTRRFDDDVNEISLARDMRYLLDWTRDNCTDCPFKRMIGDKSFVSGHSMGAGSTIYIMSDYWLGQPFKHSFDSGMTLSACGSQIDEMHQLAQNITKPILLFDGSDDCMCPVWQWADILYQNLPNDPNICSYETIITNGTHCNFAHLDHVRDAPCLELEKRDCIANDTTQMHIKEEKQLQITMQYLNMFMYATLYMDQNQNAFTALNSQISNDLKSGVIAKSQSKNC